MVSTRNRLNKQRLATREAHFPLLCFFCLPLASVVLPPSVASVLLRTSFAFWLNVLCGGQKIWRGSREHKHLSSEAEPSWVLFTRVLCRKFPRTGERQAVFLFKALFDRFADLLEGPYCIFKRVKRKAFKRKSGASVPAQRAK